MHNDGGDGIGAEELHQQRLSWEKGMTDWFMHPLVAAETEHHCLLVVEEKDDLDKKRQHLQQLQQHGLSNTPPTGMKVYYERDYSLYK